MAKIKKARSLILEELSSACSSGAFSSVGISKSKQDYSWVQGEGVAKKVSIGKDCIFLYSRTSFLLWDKKKDGFWHTLLLLLIIWIINISQAETFPFWFTAMHYIWVFSMVIIKCHTVDFDNIPFIYINFRNGYLPIAKI